MSYWGLLCICEREYFYLGFNLLFSPLPLSSVNVVCSQWQSVEYALESTVSLHTCVVVEENYPMRNYRAFWRKLCAVTNSDQDHITLPNYLEVLFITLQWMQLIELIIQFASDSIGAQANSDSRRIQYFQKISFFHKWWFNGKCKSWCINASAGAVGSSTFNERFKFLLCHFWLTLHTYCPLGGAAVQCGRVWLFQGDLLRRKSALLNKDISLCYCC
jgi:hypothetical protein